VHDPHPRVRPAWPGQHGVEPVRLDAGAPPLRRRGPRADGVYVHGGPASGAQRQHDRSRLSGAGFKHLWDHALLVETKQSVVYRCLVLYTTLVPINFEEEALYTVC